MVIMPKYQTPPYPVSPFARLVVSDKATAVRVNKPINVPFHQKVK